MYLQENLSTELLEHARILLLANGGTSDACATSWIMGDIHGEGDWKGVKYLLYPIFWVLHIMDKVIALYVEWEKEK